MKKILLFICLLCHLLAFPQAKLIYYYDNGTKIVDEYDENLLISRKTYTMGEHNVAHLRREEYFKDDEPSPYLVRGYRENGHQFYEIVKDGRNWQEADGRSNRIEFYTVDGKKNGWYREWWHNGKLFDSCLYRNDEVILDIRYDKTGKKIR